MTLYEMWDNLSLDLIEHIGYLQKEMSLGARDIDAFFEFVFSEKITKMRSILPGNYKGFVSIFFDFFLQFLCLGSFTTSIRSFEDDEAAWKITERRKIGFHSFIVQK